MREIVAVAKLDRHVLEPDLVNVMINHDPIESTFRPSIPFEVDKGRPMELHVIVGNALGLWDWLSWRCEFWIPHTGFWILFRNDCSLRWGLNLGMKCSVKFCTKYSLNEVFPIIKMNCMMTSVVRFASMNWTMRSTELYSGIDFISYKNWISGDEIEKYNTTGDPRCTCETRTTK